MSRTDDFQGDNAHLVECINALLDMDDAKALVPHGLGKGSHAYRLLNAAAHRIATDLNRANEIIAEKEAEIARLRGVVAVADDAIREMFRYYDGGEMRGSYDGKPERAQLRKAGYATSAALKEPSQ